MPKMFFAIIILLLTLPSAVLADGGVIVSDPDGYVQLNHQSAAIFWDGSTEKMILSTDMSTPTNITDMVWLIPVQSSNKPNVTKSNDSIFRILQELLNEPTTLYDYINAGTLSVSEKSGVEIIESKRINAYNITILKAQNASELVSWLNANNYTIKADAQFLLQDYCDRGFYFVANKIDLGGTDINVSNLDYNLLKTPLMISFKPKEPMYPMKFSSINPGRTQVNVYVFSNTTVEDKSSILKVQKMVENPYKQSSTLKRYLSDEKIDTSNMDYLTYLSYSGEMDSLTGDSIFIKTKYDSSLDPYWEPVWVTIFTKAGYIFAFIVITTLVFFGGLYVLFLALTLIIDRFKKLRSK